MASHSKSLYGVLSFGLAKNHRASPASALRVEILYCLPKLFSGLAALMLTESEIKALNSHRRKSLRQLQKLLPSTAIPAIYFLSGSLPAEAYLHMRQLCHLYMLASLGPKTRLYSIAIKNCTLPPKESWFSSLAITCNKYGLPSPLEILTHPPPKIAFKKQVKTAVIAYWTARLRNKAETMSSLDYLRVSHIPLGRGPHPIWLSCISPNDTRPAVIQAKMLVGIYRSCYRERHWCNTSGKCKLQGCENPRGDVLHMFTSCSFLANVVNAACHSVLYQLESFPHHRAIFSSKLESSPIDFFQFLLDPSSDRDVLALRYPKKETNIILFRASRSVIWPVHKARLRALGKERYI